jgi:hypothetical protein
MTISTSHNNFWIRTMIIMCNYKKNSIWQQKSSNQCILAWLVKVYKLIVRTNTKNIKVRNISHTINYDSSK